MVTVIMIVIVMLCALLTLLQKRLLLHSCIQSKILPPPMRHMRSDSEEAT